MRKLCIQPGRVTLILITVLSVCTSSAARRTGVPPGLLTGSQDLGKIERTVMPAVDEAALRAEDSRKEASGLPTPTRFAVNQAVKISPDSAGTWEVLADGSRLWRIQIMSDGAQSLSLGLGHFDLPPGGTFWIHDANGAWVQGPYTREDRNSRGGLWTAVILGDELVVELHLPAGGSPADIEINFVNHGYRGFEGHDSASDSKRGTCNINVVCPEGNRWVDQIRAVVRTTMADNVFSYLCTAQLMNNSRQDETPYLYTAGHCVNSPDAYGDMDPSTLVAYWNYQTANCEDFLGGSLDQNQSGSTLVAQSFGTDYEPHFDFALLLLDDVPDSEFNVYYLGWDARDVAPVKSASIHHPGGDQKSICFDDGPATISSVGGDQSPGNGNFLRIGGWDLGTTEKGASGACLYDQASGLCVGSLWGGSAACGNQNTDWFGRFHRQFTGEGTVETRLSDWLDPLGTGQLFLVGMTPGSTQSSATWLIPAVASLPGAEGSEWKSQVSVANSSSSSANAMVHFVPTGEDWPGEVLSGPHLIGPMGSLYLDDPIAAAGPTAGVLYVTADGGNTAAFSRTINLNDDGSTFGQGMPAILLNDASLETELVLPMVHSGPGRYRTNVGFTQTSSGIYRVLVSIFSPGSVLLAEKEYIINSGWKQINDIFADMGIGDTVVEGGWIRVQLIQNQPAYWTTYATVIDDATNDPTYVLPVAP